MVTVLCGMSGGRPEYLQPSVTADIDVNILLVIAGVSCAAVGWMSTQQLLAQWVRCMGPCTVVPTRQCCACCSALAPWRTSQVSYLKLLMRPRSSLGACC